jgi:nucleotide-binding universal stress UspA family protein
MTGFLVVGVDGSSGSGAAVCWAAVEARRRGVPLHLVHAWLVPLVETSVVPVLGVRGGTALRAEATRVLSEAAARAVAAAPGIEVETSLVPGDAAAALIAAAGDADLLVVGYRGTGGFAGLLAGSVAVAAVSHAACPVVVVRGQLDTARHVLVGVAGSRSCPHTVDAAFAAAWRSSVAVVAMHAYEITHPHRAFAERVAERSGTATALRDHLVAAEQDAKLLVEQQVAAARQRYPEVRVEIRVVEGPPAQELVRASAGASLVVVGKRGRGGLSALRPGSTSHALVHHAHCPVLVDR